jgi:cobalt-precorrin-6B (C15)-methyltransferase
VMNVARLEVAARAVEAVRERGYLDGVLHLQVNRGYDLAGATGFEAGDPVYLIVGRIESAADDGEDVDDETGYPGDSDGGDATGDDADPNGSGEGPT